MPLLSIRLSAVITYSASRRAFCPKSFFTLSLRPSPACWGPSAPLSDTYYTNPHFSLSHTHTHIDTQELLTPAVQLVSSGSKRCRPALKQTIRVHKKAVLTALPPVPFNNDNDILNSKPFSALILFEQYDQDTHEHKKLLIGRESRYHVCNNIDPPLSTD